MIMTKVFWSGFREHPKKSTAQSTQRSRDRQYERIWRARIIVGDGYSSYLVPDAFSRIRDFAQDCGTLCAGCGREISRQPLPRLEGQHRECDGLFRVGRKPEIVG